MKSDQGDGEDLPPESKVGLPGLDERTEEEIIEDLRKRARLGPERLPSICLTPFSIHMKL